MAKKGNTPKENVRCMECAKAALLQWDKNPVVAHCRESAFPNVANTLRTCAYFKPSDKKSEIRHLTHFK